MIQITQLKMPVLHTREELEAQIAGFLRVRPEEIKSWKIARRSIDARKREDLKMVYTQRVNIKILCQFIRSGTIFQRPVMRNFFTRRS